MTRPKLLDLFCGAGGCAVGYHRAGFDVVGVDIKPQPNYPFTFVQHEAVSYLQDWWQSDRYDGQPFPYHAIHASPPCQAYSVSGIPHGKRHLHPDLVGTMREIMDWFNCPWVMENVVGAPMKPPTIMLCGMMFGLRVLRHRLFESNVFLTVPSHPKHPDGMLTNSHRAYNRGQSRFLCVVGHNFAREEGENAMGIDWMGSRRELSQAIPPAYTEYIGAQLMRYLKIAS